MPENSFLCVDIAPTARQGVVIKPFVGAFLRCGQSPRTPVPPARYTPSGRGTRRPGPKPWLQTAGNYRQSGASWGTLQAVTGCSHQSRGRGTTGGGGGAGEGNARRSLRAIASSSPPFHSGSDRRVSVGK